MKRHLSDGKSVYNQNPSFGDLPDFLVIVKILNANLEEIYISPCVRNESVDIVAKG